MSASPRTPLRRSPPATGLLATPARSGSAPALTFESPALRVTGLRPALVGSHQLENFALACAAAERFCVELGRPLPANALRVAAREGGWWPARFETGRTHRGAHLVLDGAHNPHGCDALAAALDARFGAAPRVLVFGALADKAAGRMLRTLAHGARAVVLVRPPSARAADPASLTRALDAATRAHTRVAPSPAEGLALALADAGRGEVVVVAGSLYLAGALRPLLRRKAKNFGVRNRV